MAGLKKSQRRVKGKPFFNAGHVARGKKLEALKAKAGKQFVKRARSSPRLYMKGVMASYRRGLNNQDNNTTLLRIDNVVTKGDAKWYAGKRVAYVYHGYKAKRCVRWNQAPARRSNTRAMWGRITRTHGTSGMVRAKWSSNLPANSLGRRVRVYLYPSRV